MNSIIAFLLEHGDSSIQYRIKREILNESHSNKELLNLQKRIIEKSKVKKIIAYRQSDGWIGAGLEDLGKGLRSQVGTLYGTLAKGSRYLEMAEGYIKTIALDKDNQICGYEFVHMGKFMDEIKKGTDANEALKKVTGTYGRFTAEQGAVKHIDPRHE